MEQIEIVGIFLLCLAAIGISAIFARRWRENKHPIRVSIWREISDRNFVRVGFYKLKIDAIDCEHASHKYPIRQTDKLGEGKKAIDMKRDNRFLFFDFEEGKDDPLSWRAIIAPDADDLQTITDSHFLSDLFPKVPRMYYLVMIAVMIVAAVAVGGALYEASQVQSALTQVNTVTGNIANLNMTYYQLGQAYNNLYQWAVAHGLQIATNGTIIVR